MLRALSTILAALELVAPKFQHKAEASVHVQALAIKYELDPFTIISVVRNESGWQAGAINRRSGARGLGQIMPSNYHKCVDAPDSLECERLKTALLGWKFNLSETARTLATWRAYCNRRVGSELAIHWLPGYQGLDMRRGAICGHHKRSNGWIPLKDVPALTEKVLAKRRELAARFAPKRKTPRAPAPVAAPSKTVRGKSKPKTAKSLTRQGREPSASREQDSKRRGKGPRT